MSNICRDVHKLSRMVTRLHDWALAPLGITSQQFLLLEYICEHQSCTQQQISDDLHSDKSTVSRSTRILERAGLITRTDRLLSLTDAGRAIYSLSLPSWLDAQYRSAGAVDHKALESMLSRMEIC
jgi:DNA-binding MarR family transcriptional regulator